MSLSHSRNASEETTASGSSYQIILEHLMQYPGSYEIPLRTMYTLNCAPRAQPLPSHFSRAATPTSTSSSPSPTSSQFAWSDAGNAAAHFTSALMSQISQLPSQPCSLPPSFIVSFVARCFHPQLIMVDFPQALTALDYLKDLETRRRNEMAAAFRRLGVLPNTVGTEADDFSDRYPGVAKWVATIEAKEKKAEAYYTQLYVGLRRWVLINELSLEPFNKHNCVAMLNTLYPPVSSSQPTRILTPTLLKNQRDGFFKYIQSVERHGPTVLKTVMDQGKLEGDNNGWGAVQKCLDKYLLIAKNMIDDCCEVANVDHFGPAEEPEKRKGKKTDSGVSFGSEHRPSTSNSMKDKPLPPSPTEHKSAQKGLSALERITREFKRMRVKSKPEIEEIVKQSKNAALQDITDSDNQKKPKTIKKMRSMGALQTLKAGNMSSTSLVGRRKASDTADYDADEMKRQRVMYETSTKPKGIED
ncbi:hypothetical protein K432DRAFT_389465 [Lepidopterella palustris CBS 459.81]|uniref:Uncharacterized protein n=1 Tax=Lepidopterella palustris CBS 459.81 TaxID=1314670 RepID=A0A8E2EIK7_9PEZI|nr:hypothetical protein K432DRAFT_389465 [Lepidopterella palustris CBS 459.81]